MGTLMKWMEYAEGQTGREEADVYYFNDR